MENEQVIEVDYDEELVKEYIENKDTIIEGTGSDEVDIPMYGLQTSVNTDGVDELLGEGAVILDE